MDLKYSVPAILTAGMVMLSGCSRSLPPGELDKPSAIQPEQGEISFDFTAMSFEEQKTIVKETLDKATAFCDYRDVRKHMIENASEMIARTNSEGREEYYPTDYPYHSIEEMRQDMLTVFSSPEVLDDRFSYLFEGAVDYNDQIYATGYASSQARTWNCEKMEIKETAPESITVSMPVKGQWGDERLASVTLEYSDGNVRVGEDYFAKETIHPKVPSIDKIESLDFTKMTFEEQKAVIKSVLERAAMFCGYGETDDYTDYFPSPSEIIKRPFHTWKDCEYYPSYYPYSCINEMKLDMYTVFKPSMGIPERELSCIFDNLVDYNDRIYVYPGTSGLNKRGRWDAERMEVLEVTPEKITVSMPTAYGAEYEEHIEPLTFEYYNGYVVVGYDYWGHEPH